MTETPIRILVVDDTVTYRMIISKVLAEIPGIEVVGVAANGKIAVSKIVQLNPDIITLDLEMPEMDGLDVLRYIRDRSMPVGAIMLSAFTSEGADSTVKALNLGAFDFVVKPTCDNIDDSRAALKAALEPKIQAYARTTLGSKAPNPVKTDVPKVVDTKASDVMSRMSAIASRPLGRKKAVGIGISTGGPQALMKMLPMLPQNLGVPILIVQHMPPMFTKSLADDLNKRCSLGVSEAANGDVIKAGHVYIAPGGKQMKVIKRGVDSVIAITDDPAENSCKPSVDYLFRSMSFIYNGDMVGVIMTGMGNDGTLGCRLLKRAGASIIAQDAASCVVYGMPEQPTREGLVDVVASLDNIAGEITGMLKGVVACK